MEDQRFPGIPERNCYHEVKERKDYADEKSAEEEVPKENDFLAFHRCPAPGLDISVKKPSPIFSHSVKTVTIKIAWGAKLGISNCVRWAGGRNFLRRLRAQKSGEGVAVTPEQEELEDRDDESRCKTFGRHECVENQYIEDDRGEDGKPQRNKAADE